MSHNLNGSNHESDLQTTQNQEENAGLTGSVLQLLEERLVIDRSRRKIGEVIVRKEVHTRFVEVPVRYEQLIIEQISPNLEQLAAIDLGYGEVTGIDPELQNLNSVLQNREATGLRVNFTSLEDANQVLMELAHMLKDSNQLPQIEIVLKDQDSQTAYLSWLDRRSC